MARCNLAKTFSSAVYPGTNLRRLSVTTTSRPSLAHRIVRIACLLQLLPAFCSAGVIHAQSIPADYEIVRIGVEQGLSQRLVYDILEDHQGYIWMATREGLNRFDGHRFTTYLHEPGDPTSLPDSKVSKLLETADGTLWIGTLTGGLARFDRKTETFSVVPSDTTLGKEPLSEGVMDLVEHPDGSIWAASRNRRLFQLPPGKDALEPVIGRIGGQAVDWTGGLGMAIDREGGVFTQCSFGNGPSTAVHRMDADTLECQPLEGIVSNGILSGGTTGSDGAVTLIMDAGTSAEGATSRVARWNQGLNWSAVLNAAPSRDVVVDQDGNSWIGTYEGLWVLSPDGTLLYRFQVNPMDPASLSDNRVNSVIVTRDGSIWAATHDGATVFRPRNTPFRVIRSVEGQPGTLSDPRVNAILESQDGTVWVGTSNGLNWRRPGSESFETMREPDAPRVRAGSQHRIWSLLEADDRRIWIGTAAASLHAFDPRTSSFSYLPEYSNAIHRALGDPLPSTDRHPIPFMGRDGDGNVWLASGDVLVRGTPDAGFEVTRVRVPGAPSFLEGVHVLFTTSDGSTWVGSNAGLHRFDPSTGRLTPVGQTRAPGMGLSGPVVWSLTESPKTPGVLWIATVGSGLTRFDLTTGRFDWFTIAQGLPSNTIYGLLVDGQGLLWMSTTRGLVRFDPLTHTVEHFTRHDGLHDNEFDLMAFHRGARSGRMWFGGPTGLTEFHPDSVSRRAFAFPVLFSGIRVSDAPRSGLAVEGDTLRLFREDRSVTFELSAPDFLHPQDAGYLYRLVGYDVDWRTADARAPSISYTGLPPGSYVLEVQPVRPGESTGGPLSRLHVLVVPEVWQTFWFQLISGVGLIGVLVWGISRRQRRRAQGLLMDAHREVELKRLLAEREERERTRLAREIHDGPIQTLYSVNHRLEDASTEDLETSRRDVQELAAELRAICEQLRPVLVANLGLEAALKARIRTLSRSKGGIHVGLTVDLGESPLPEPVENACFRIAEEALSNALQHARAQRIDLTIHRTGDACQLKVSDDGRGFDMSDDWLELARNRHYGLVGMRERALLAGGTCLIESAPGMGTRISVEFPLHHAS